MLPICLPYIFFSTKLSNILHNLHINFVYSANLPTTLQTSPWQGLLDLLMGLQDLEQCLWYEPVLVGIRGNEQVETEVPPHTVQASIRIPSRAEQEHPYSTRNF